MGTCQALKTPGYGSGRPRPRSRHPGPPAPSTPGHLGCVDEPPRIEQAESVLVAVAEACLVGDPVCVAILILWGQRSWSVSWISKVTSTA